MVDEIDSSASSGALEQQWTFCVQHAEQLVESAERLLGDPPMPNIAYHLAILALEEVGKAGMLRGRAVVGSARDSSWMNRRLDDHVYKLMWAFWSPSLYGERIDPARFEEAREFARRVHAQRIEGLYSNHSENPAHVSPPSEAVSIEEARSILKLAQSLVALQKAEGELVLDPSNDELRWFLETTSTEEGFRHLLSAPFLDKYEELEGDARAWITWARGEFARMDAEVQDTLERELARAPNETSDQKPKWRMRIRLRSLLHTIRPKALNFWNDRIEVVKLRDCGKKRKNEFILELTMHDGVPVKDVFDAGRAQSAKCIVALNIGCGGFIWYEVSSQSAKYYEELRDLDAPNIAVEIGRVQALENARRKDQDTLTEGNLLNAIKCLAIFGPLSNEDGAPIFGPYLQGMALLSKHDLHLNLAQSARDAFLRSTHRAIQHFGVWDGEGGSLRSSLHGLLGDWIKQETDRDVLIDALAREEIKRDDELMDALEAKRGADLCLMIIAAREWPEFIRNASP